MGASKPLCGCRLALLFCILLAASKSFSSRSHNRADSLKITGSELCVTQMTGIMVMTGNKHRCGCRLGGVGWLDGEEHTKGQDHFRGMTSFSACCQDVAPRWHWQGSSQSFSQFILHPYNVHPHTEGGWAKQISTLAVWCFIILAREKVSGTQRGADALICVLHLSATTSSSSSAHVTAGAQSWQWAFHCRHSLTHKAP